MHFQVIQDEVTKEPVLHLEQCYSTFLSPQEQAALQKLACILSDEMGIPLNKWIYPFASPGNKRYQALEYAYGAS